MHTAETLIRTKLRVPFTRPGLVPRPRLQARIAEGLSGPLTLITAPAGFGKTTLVASCLAACGVPVAWLSLDKDDNQAGRFLKYLIAALQQADPAIGNEAAQFLAAARPAPPETVLPSVVNDLDAAVAGVALVLDDYQFVSSQAVHQQVAFLLDHCPTTFHLVIATRSDPPLPLTRLRARGQMVELRAADLAFSEPEAARFLNDVMGLRLDAGAVAVLEERTEGWIAGLQMAALSMRDHQDIPGFIAGFSGTNRYILDYLLEEVLAAQPPRIRHFLLHTSILDRLTAALCDAVLGQPVTADSILPDSPSLPLPDFPIPQIPNSPVPDSPIPDSPLPASQPILEYLDRANLFLVPLDDERTWYRYHHLFADLLRAQLHRVLDARSVTQLHIRAADWHAQHGSTLEAIHHGSAAADDERVERFIEQNYMEMVRRGEMFGMRSWTSTLSPELVSRRPWLCAYEAYSHSWFGELDEAERLLAAAQDHLPSDVSAPDTQAMLAQLYYVKSRVTAMRGDLAQAIEFCLAARERIPAGNLSLEFDSRVTLGYEYFLQGDYARALPSLQETIRSGTTTGAIINTVAAACVLARLYAVQGRLQQSGDTYRAAAQLIPAASGEYRDARALVEMGLADVCCEWNDLDAAVAHIRQGLALLPWWGKPDDLVLAHLTLARIHLAQARTADALAALEKAARIAQGSGLFPEARRAVQAAQVKGWLAQGNLQLASRWASAQAGRLDSDDGFAFESELAHLALARVWLAQNKLGPAIERLSHLAEPARSAGRMGRVMEILLLQALVLEQTGDSAQAFLTLGRCLALAQPEGYVRLFLDEGRPLQVLLARWLAHAGPGPLHDYARRLLAHFDAEPYAAPALQETGTGDLVEPLTGRELEVLHLIALGHTNQEIARQLVVAPGTVKAHTASIYRKLDVANRTEAVARARYLGLLP